MEAAQDLEHIVAVGAAVEPVLVLHHRHIELVQQVRTAVREGGDPLTSSPITRSHGGGCPPHVDDPYDARLARRVSTFPTPAQR